MSTSRFSAAATPRNGRWTSSAGLIAVNLQPNEREGTPRRSAISCVSIGRPSGCRKSNFLERRLGIELDRERLVQFGRDRAREGAGPVTLGIDLGYIKTILSHAAAVHGEQLSTEPIDLVRIALGRLGLVGKGIERDRRPTQDEIDRIIGLSRDRATIETPQTSSPPSASLQPSAIGYEPGPTAGFPVIGSRHSGRRGRHRLRPPDGRAFPA